MAFAKAFSNDVHIAKYSTIQYIKRLLLGYGNTGYSKSPTSLYVCWRESWSSRKIQKFTAPGNILSHINGNWLLMIVLKFWIIRLSNFLPSYIHINYFQKAIAEYHHSVTWTPGRDLHRTRVQGSLCIFVNVEPECRAVDLRFPPLSRCLHQAPSPSRYVSRFVWGTTGAQSKCTKQKDCSPSGCSLDLGHGWPTSTDTSPSDSWTRATSWHEVNGQRAHEGSKQEPEERCAGLQLVASLCGVERAVG